MKRSFKQRLSNSICYILGILDNLISLLTFSYFLPTWRESFENSRAVEDPPIDDFLEKQRRTGFIGTVSEGRVILSCADTIKVRVQSEEESAARDEKFKYIKDIADDPFAGSRVKEAYGIKKDV